MGGIPDLRFLRRSGLAYSFTGEKLTGEQLAEAFGIIRGDYPAMEGADFLTCFPSQPDTDPIPHYKLTLIRGDGLPGMRAAGNRGTVRPVAHRVEQGIPEQARKPASGTGTVSTDERERICSADGHRAGGARP